jgi:MFS family permease
MAESFSSSGSDSTTTTDSNTATYAAIMVSVFTFGEFIAAPQWARISDRIGRKPTLLVGSVGAVISAMIFGFSSSLPMAIAARAFAGLANPNLGVVKTFVGELVSKDHQGKMCAKKNPSPRKLSWIFCSAAKGFSVVPFLRGLG